MPREKIWKVCKIKAASMAARRACQSLNQDLQLGVSQAAAMLPIKASCVMGWDRSSRGTRSGLSKSAERIRSGDKFRKTAYCGFGHAVPRTGYRFA